MTVIKLRRARPAAVPYTLLESPTTEEDMTRRKRSWLTIVAAEDIVKIVPKGYKLAVLKVPFSRKLRLTWWLDANGRIGRAGTE